MVCVDNGKHMMRAERASQNSLLSAKLIFQDTISYPEWQIVVTWSGEWAYLPHNFVKRWSSRIFQKRRESYWVLVFDGKYFSEKTSYKHDERVNFQKERHKPGSFELTPRAKI